VGGDSQNHPDILSTYRNTVKASGLLSPIVTIPLSFFLIFKTQDAAMAAKTNLKPNIFAPNLK